MVFSLPSSGTTVALLDAFCGNLNPLVVLLRLKDAGRASTSLLATEPVLRGAELSEPAPMLISISLSPTVGANSAVEVEKVDTSSSHVGVDMSLKIIGVVFVGDITGVVEMAEPPRRLARRLS